MTRTEILTHLQRWAEVIRKMQSADDALDALTGRSPESPIARAIFDTAAAYTETLETLLIGSAESGWLEWYWLDNDMGEKAYTVTTDAGERPIGSLDALADLLMERRA